jgi:hypothetical protein
MKWFIRVTAGLFIVVIVAIVALILVLDGVTRYAVEQSAGVALKVPTRLDGAAIRILGTRFELHELDVANPEGFDETPRFLRLGHAKTDLSLFDLPREHIELDQLVIEDIDVYLERKEGCANYRVILENLKEFQQQRDPAAQRELAVREVILRDITVSVRIFPIGGEATRMELKIPEMKLDNVGTGDNGVSTAQLVGIVTTSLFAGIFRQGAGILPDDMLQELGKGVAALGQLGHFGLTIAGETFSGAVQLIGVVAEGIGSVGEEILQGVGGSLEGIGELFRRRDVD